MKPLSPADQLFLWLEKRQQPMHVAGLQLFKFPEDAGPRYIRDLVEHLRSFKEPQAPFNQRLISRFGQYFWEEDDQFDLEHHFRHRALPKPGRIRELLAYVSAAHSNLMDRQRPMWEVHLIEGVQGRRFALYSKVHHCMFDGIAAMRMSSRALSTDVDTRDVPPIWAMPRVRRASAGLPSPVDMASGLARFTGALSKQVATMPRVMAEIAKVSRKSQRDPNFVTFFQAPPSILNGPITGSRRFAAQSYPIERFQRIAKAFNATINDVVLTICGSALRNYLISQQALPDAPLISMVPVSLRRDDSSEGNQIAMILANLGTHIADPAHRLQVVQASVKEAKQRYKAMSPAEILNYTALMMAPAGINLMTGLASGLRAFNVIISNVPGPKEPLYWNGARLTGQYPVSIPIDQVALNITLTSYVDQLEFGLTACRRTLPSMQRLLDYLEYGLDELEIACGQR